MLIPSGRYALGTVRFYKDAQATIATKGPGNEIVVALLDSRYGMIVNIPPRITDDILAEDRKVEWAIQNFVRVRNANILRPANPPSSGSSRTHHGSSKVYIFGPLDLTDARVCDQLSVVRKTLDHLSVRPVQHLAYNPEGQEKTIIMTYEPAKDQEPANTSLFLNGHQVHSCSER